MKTNTTATVLFILARPSIGSRVLDAKRPRKELSPQSDGRVSIPSRLLPELLPSFEHLTRVGV
jgi:hypothetical protein